MCGIKYSYRGIVASFVSCVVEYTIVAILYGHEITTRKKTGGRTKVFCQKGNPILNISAMKDDLLVRTSDMSHMFVCRKLPLGVIHKFSVYLAELRRKRSWLAYTQLPRSSEYHKHPLPAIPGFDTPSTGRYSVL